MATHAQIVQEMVDALSLSEPDLDTGIGSITRKLIDVVAEQIAERDLDSYLIDYIYDIDAKSGADLDEMVRLFGFSRLPAQRATGEISFGRSTPSTTAILIPQGTQVTTSSGVVALTVVPIVLSPGDLQVSAPAMAVEGGTRGNVAAASLTTLKTAVSGITIVTNIVAFTGGTDQEDDAHLRRRFKETIFRNMAGTEQMYLGIALNDPSVTQANVTGASKRFRERIELVGGTATSTVQDAAFILPDTVVFGTSIDGGSIFSQDVHYTFNSGVIPPTITSLDSTAAPDGVYDLEFAYTPRASRNDPTNGITNRIDIYVKGERPVNGSETLIHQTARQFNNTSTDPLYRQNFRRRDEAVPVNGNFFIPYSQVPLIDPSVSDQIVINSVTYIEGTHYWLVYDITSRGGAPRSLAGIELRSSANGSPLADPPNDARFQVNYVFNEVPRSVEAAIDNWRLVGTDVWVHEAKLQRLRLHFAVILANGFAEAVVKADLIRALSTYIDSIGFRSVLQASDLLNVAHNVSGVDSIRFLTDSDNPTNYAIQRVTEAGTVVQTYATGVTPKRALDVYCGDDESPVLDDVILDVRAQNTWGSV